MDLHVLIVIACVFLVSLFSLLFINKFFRGKTFEEVAAEKRLLAEKLYGTSKVKHRQQQRKTSIKKELKKEKKQKLKDSNAALTAAKENDVESQNDSDIQSETQSVESSPSHQKKVHVEFSEPEIIDKKKEKQQRKVSSNVKPGSGILVNKSEPVVVKETLASEPLNHFDVKPPKDVVELKKQSLKDENGEGKIQNENKPLKDIKAKESKKSKAPKKEEKDKNNETTSQQQQQQPQEAVVVKEIKHQEEKIHKNSDSPKIQNKHHQQQQQKTKKKFENSIVEQLSGSDVIGVNTLMLLFNQAELNRSEIQILIDYLLNKQQDTPINHSEWSDDIVQKLKKQLNEKEKALQDEQEASAGIQAKLRDLRTEINTERIHFNATTKMYMEKLQTKDTEIMNLNQEIQNLNEKLNLERQQFQAKLRHEKQQNSQELLQQIQQLNEHNTRLQSENVQLQMIANASHQNSEDTKQKLNDIIQQQQQQIIQLEQNLTDAKTEIERQQYDLELAKIVENEKESHKVEIRNLQNALDSKQSELQLIEKQLKDNQLNMEQLNQKYEILKNQIDTLNDKYLEQTKNYDQIQLTLTETQTILNDKTQKLHEYEVTITTLTNKEDELMKQINEQKEKNNELRTKNWKLVEALQKAEMSANASGISTTANVNRNLNNLVTQDEQKIRELFQRLFPEAVKLSSGSALTLSFDQWIEQVISTHIKQYINNNSLNRDNLSSNNNKISTEENNHNISNYHHQNKKLTSLSSSSSQTELLTSNHHHHHHRNYEKSSNDDDNKNNSNNSEETKQILLENIHLKAKVEQLTSIVTKTENLLTNLESQARDQEAHWRNIVQSKQEEIHLLKNLLENPNGQAI